MKKTKICLLVMSVLVFCAAARAGAYMIYTAPDYIHRDASRAGRAHGISSYISVCAGMCKFFTKAGRAQADQENSLTLASDNTAGETGESKTDYLSQNPEKTPVFLPKVSMFLFMFLGFAGTFFTFGRSRYEDAKRLFDIIVSFLALLLLSPVLLLCMILIKIDSKGPVLFRQIRVGLNRRKNSETQNLNMPQRKDENLGKLFHIYKLRTMCVDAEEKSGPVWAKKNDNRITSIGKILRKTHLDEIPQFYNVLRGDMSIIGPRPERPMFVNEHRRYFSGRFGVKPGITGLAQVRQSYAATLSETKKKLRYDKLYIKKQSIPVDIMILLNTVRRVVADNAAH